MAKKPSDTSVPGAPEIPSDEELAKRYNITTRQGLNELKKRGPRDRRSWGERAGDAVSMDLLSKYFQQEDARIEAEIKRVHPSDEEALARLRERMIREKLWPAEEEGAGKSQRERKR